jgi:hypothetical protein
LACSSSPCSQIPNSIDLHRRNAGAKSLSRDLDRDPHSCGGAEIGFPSLHIARNKVQKLCNCQSVQCLYWHSHSSKASSLTAMTVPSLNKREGLVLTRCIQRLPTSSRSSRSCARRCSRSRTLMRFLETVAPFLASRCGEPHDKGRQHTLCEGALRKSTTANRAPGGTEGEPVRLPSGAIVNAVIPHKQLTGGMVCKP